MFDQRALGKELQALKAELAALMGSARDDGVGASKARTEALVDQVKTTLTEFGEILADKDHDLGRLVAERPVAALASAFALGLVVGLALRRS